jgi:hypothetical protein
MFTLLPGLTEAERAALQRLCNVQLFAFPFSDYPPSVHRLSEYRWKPIIWAV